MGSKGSTTTMSAVTCFASVRAQGTVTGASTWIADGDTLQIGTQTYRFKTVPAQINDIFLTANSSAGTDAALASLVKAINGTGVAGTDMFTGTLKHTEVRSVVGSVAHTAIFSALMPGVAGNRIAFVKTSSGLSVDAATLGTTVAGSGDSNIDLVNFITRALNETQLSAKAEQFLLELQTELQGTT